MSMRSPVSSRCLRSDWENGLLSTNTIGNLVRKSKTALLLALSNSGLLLSLSSKRDFWQSVKLIRINQRFGSFALIVSYNWNKIIDFPVPATPDMMTGPPFWRWIKSSSFILGILWPVVSSIDTPCCCRFWTKDFFLSKIKWIFFHIWDLSSKSSTNHSIFPFESMRHLLRSVSGEISCPFVSESESPNALATSPQNWSSNWHGKKVKRLLM